MLRFITNFYKNEAFLLIYGKTLSCTGSSKQKSGNKCLLLLAEQYGKSNSK